MTLSSTWPRAVAPVRRGQVTPHHRGQRGKAGRIAAGRGIPLAGLPVRRGPNAGTCPPAVPSASQPRAGRDGGVLIHPQEGMLQEAPGLCSRAPPTTNIERGRVGGGNTGWPDWSSWASASPAISAGSRRDFQLYLAATVANLTPGGGQKSTCRDSVGGGAESPPRRPAVPSPSDVQAVSHGVCRQCYGHFRRGPTRKTMVPDSVRLGFTAEIPLPNQGFSARFSRAVRRPTDSRRRTSCAGEERLGKTGGAPQLVTLATY